MKCSRGVTRISNQDPYYVLGVERGDSYDDIKKAYFKLAQSHHPDISEDSDSA